MEIRLHGNFAQMAGLMFNAKNEVSVAGRGTGKSYAIGYKIDQIVRSMPGSVTAITGKTYGQILTRTLPSSLKLLEQMGYQQGVNYVIGKRPPSWFRNSYEQLNKFDNIISFSNGCRFVMISQSEQGSGRGANTDYEIVDEALLINEEQYNNEVVPTNRGNNEFFGPKSSRPVRLHHGHSYFTSMPTDKEGRWVLKHADYYLKERGIRLFDTWNRIVTMQIEMLETVRSYRLAKQSGDKTGEASLLAQFQSQWGEIARVKRSIAPFVSKEGSLFTVSNAFDNLEMLGIDYILNAQSQMPSLIFLVEIMNMYIDKVVDCFYNINESKVVYYGYSDNDRLAELAVNNNYRINENLTKSSLYDLDCDPDAPLEVSFDWGSSISLMVVDQERHYDFVNKAPSQRICQTQINEFYVKPDGSDKVMIQQLIGDFCTYYKSHKKKIVHFYKDKYGDHKNPNVMNSKTFNEMAYEELRKSGWNIIVKEHRRMEPYQSDRYNLWALILSESNPNMPLWRINGDRCKYTLVSMNNAKVKNVDNKFVKDKSSEKPSSGVLPEEATHFSDARDKLIWTKYGEKMTVRRRESFVGFSR